MTDLLPVEPGALALESDPARPCGFCLDGDHAECERPVRTQRTVRQTWTYPAEYIVTECCCEATS